MRRLAVLAAGIVLACGQAAKPEAVTPVTASPSGPPPATASPGAPPPVLFNCRLPVVTYPGRTASGPRVAGRGAWLDLATGSLTIDAASPTADRLFYSRSAKQWFPVGRDAVSPDGLQYAFVAPGGGFGADPLHVVNSSSGKETLFPLPPPGVMALWGVLDFSPPLVTLASSYRAISQLDLRTGKVTSIAVTPPVWAIDGSTAWTGSVNPADPSPQQGFGGPQPDQVERVTIGGGRETWLYREGTSVAVVGVDAHGSPIVSTYRGVDAPSELLLVTAPNGFKTLATSTSSGAGGPAAVDSHGTWFTGRDGIYLLSDGGGLQKVSDVVATPAGGCA